MGRSIVNIRSSRDDPKWIDGGVTPIVMFLDVFHVYCTAHSRDLEDVFRVIEEIRVFAQQLPIALEVNRIDLVKPNEADKQADISFCHLIPAQVSLMAENALTLI